MAKYNRSHINTNGSFNTGQKQSLLKTFDELQAEISGGGAFTPTAAPTALTNSTGGTADNTVAAIPAATAATTDTSAASLASVNTAITTLNNDLADLTVKLNALRTALVTSGILT